MTIEGSCGQRLMTHVRMFDFAKQMFDVSIKEPINLYLPLSILNSNKRFSIITSFSINIPLPSTWFVIAGSHVKFFDFYEHIDSHVDKLMYVSHIIIMIT